MKTIVFAGLLKIGIKIKSDKFGSYVIICKLQCNIRMQPVEFGGKNRNYDRSRVIRDNNALAVFA